MKETVVTVMVEATAELVKLVNDQLRVRPRETVWGVLVDKEQQAELVLSVAAGTPPLVEQGAKELHGSF